MATALTKNSGIGGACPAIRKHHGPAGIIKLEVPQSGDNLCIPWLTKLRQLKMLQKGWNSYFADPPSSTASANAEKYLDALRSSGLEPTRLEASAMGGVGLTHRHGKRKVYIEFYNDGTVHALFSDGTPGMFTKRLTPTASAYAVHIAEAREYLYG